MSTILVVDDDAGVREMVAHLIELMGYDVRTAKSGNDALAVRRKDRIDLVIADVDMPDMDGLEFLRQLTDGSAHPKVIVMSTGGHQARGSVRGRGEPLPASLTVEKPFTAHQLMVAINRSLGDGGVRGTKKK